MKSHPLFLRKLFIEMVEEYNRLEIISRRKNDRMNAANILLFVILLMCGLVDIEDFIFYFYYGLELI